MALKYKVGDRVKIKSLNWYNENKDKDGIVELSTSVFVPGMSQFCGKVMTIEDVFEDTDGNVMYYMKEIDWDWTDEMIEGLVEEEEIEFTEEDKYWCDIMSESDPNTYVLPQGYQFKDENGNVINATMIVLEKKKKDVNLTQEQINTMVHDSCVLFCKHCGCGIPRDTCTSLGTCKEHDEYRTAIRTHLMEKKKKEYPKTYQECCKVLHYAYEQGITMRGVTEKEEELFKRLIVLKRCRDAYWKIAGEEMKLGKPWKPDYDSGVNKYGIICINGVVQKSNPTTNWERHLNKVFDFPTPEMRDSFKNNFDPDIEFCKELL